MPPNRSAVAAHIAATPSSSATFTPNANASPEHSDDGLLGEREVEVGDADLRALRREDDRRLATHAAAGARDHADLPVESPPSLSPPSR